MQKAYRDRALAIALPVNLATSGRHSSELRRVTSGNQEILPLTPVMQKQFNRREIIPLKPDQIWQIDQGCGRTVSCNEEGEMITLGFWQAGELISQPRFTIDPYQVECLSVVQASLLNTDSWNYQKLIAQIEQAQAQQAQDLLIILYSRQIESRLLNLLKWLAQQFGQKITQGWVIDLNLTHQDIADVLGTTRVTVTRLLKKLTQQGTVHWLQQRQIVLSHDLRGIPSL